MQETPAPAPSRLPRWRTILPGLWRRTNWRRGWRRARLFWKALSSFVLSLTAVATVILFGTLLTRELTHQALVVQPISVPKQLEENGYSAEVAARRFRDAIDTFVTQAHTAMKGPEIALRGEVPEIVVPTVGISIDSIAEAVRGFLHNSLHRRVSGEFTILDHALSLRLRLDGRELPGIPAANPPQGPDELLARAVPELLKEIEPYVVASHLSKTDPEQALKLAQQTIARLSPEDENVINSYLLEASVYQDRKNYTEATAAVTKALQIDPRSAAAHNSLGNVFYLQHRLDEAMREYRRANKLDWKMTAAYGNIGNVLLEQHKYENALIEYRKALALDPNCGSCRNSIGNVLSDQNKKEEAIAEYRKAIELSPDNVEPYIDWGNVLRDRRQYEQAKAQYRRAIDVQPTNAVAHSGLGNVLADTHKNEEAAAEYRKAIELDPDLPAAHANLGNVLREAHQSEEANAEYNKAIALDPKYANAHNGLGNILNDADKKEEATAEYRRALELDPRDAVARAFLFLVRLRNVRP